MGQQKKNKVLNSLLVYSFHPFCDWLHNLWLDLNCAFKNKIKTHVELVVFEIIIIACVHVLSFR